MALRQHTAPRPEEPRSRAASRRMATDALAAILRDAASRLLTMRSGNCALPAQRRDPLPDAPPAALFERIGLAPGAIFLNPGHLFGPFAMLGQYRRGRTIDDVAPDQPRPHGSVP